MRLARKLVRMGTQWSGLSPAALSFLAGTFASNVGNGMHTLAAGLLLYQGTGSVAAFGIVIVIEQAVTFLMQAIAGPFVDNSDPRRTAVAAEVVRGASVCALSLMLAIDPGHALLWILAMSLVIRIVHAFHRSATFALTPDLVAPSELVGLNSWFSACQQGGQLIGLGATDFVIAQWGAPAAFFINGATFLLSATSLAAIVVPRRAHFAGIEERSGPIWQQVWSGWRELVVVLRRAPSLIGLVVVSTADNVAFMLFNLLLAPLVAERLAAAPNWLSLMAGGFALGAMLASALVVRTAAALGAQASIALGIAGQALCFALLSSTGSAWAMLILAMALGAFNTISWTTALTVVQRDAPPTIRGRIAMLRNALAAIIMAPLVPLVSMATHAHSSGTAVLIASLVCLLFLALAGVTMRCRSTTPACARRKTAHREEPIA